MNFVFLPPHSTTTFVWRERLEAHFPDASFRAPVNESEVHAQLQTADAAFGTFSPSTLAIAPALRWLQAPAAAPPAGFYFDELIEHQAVVTNFRGIYNDHISYYVLGVMLNFTKHLHDYRDLQRERRWQPLSGPSYNQIYLPEATALIVGAGGIGLETARLLKTLGMRVIATDARRTQPSEWLDELHPADDLHALLPQADFVISNIPHTPTSEGMFNAECFAQMKRSAIFINVGRGMTTSLDDLNAALRAGEIAGAALDVFEIEPLPAEHPLWDAPNTILTPHVAVQEAAYLDERRYQIIERNVERFLAGESLINAVDKRHWF